MIEPELMTAQTPYGLVQRLGPQVKLSKTPGQWRTPLVAVRGGDTVNWVLSRRDPRVILRGRVKRKRQDPRVCAGRSGSLTARTCNTARHRRDRYRELNHD